MKAFIISILPFEDRIDKLEWFQDICSWNRFAMHSNKALKKQQPIIKKGAFSSFYRYS